MKITPLKMWVQNVLPVVYDDSLSYYEMVGKINEKTNEIIGQVNENTDGIQALNKIIEQLGDVDELRALLEQVETIINDLYTSDVPLMDSENGSAGVAEHAARSDHSHPKDSSKVDKSGLYTSDTPVMDSANGSAGVADHAARSDHSHPKDSSKADKSLGITGSNIGQYVKVKTVNNGVPTSFESAEIASTSKKWIFIGDSYGHSSGTNQGWIDKLIPMLGLTQSDYFENAIGGASFTGGSTSETSLKFLTLLSTLAQSIANKNSITDIVVLGGANELGVGADVIQNSIEEFNNYAYSTFPKAIVRIGFIGGSADYTKVGVQYSRAKEGYSNCGKAQYLNNLEFVFQNRNLLDSGGVHPNANGYTVLTNKIYEALNGGCNVIYRENGAPVPPAGFSPITGANHYQVVVHNELTNVTLFNRPGKVASDSSYYFGVTNNTPIIVTTVPSKLFLCSGLGNFNMLISGSLFATIRSTINNTRYQVKGICFISGADNNLYFTPNDTILGTTSAFNSCDLIEVDSVSFAGASITT